MFGNYFKHVLVLTLLAGISYSLPQVQSAMVGAFSISSNNVAAAIASIPQPIVVKEIKAKVAYDSKRKESAINITAKVQISSVSSDMSIADNSFYFSLTNKTLNTTSGAQSSKVTTSLSQGEGGFYTVKQGTTALFNVTATIIPSSMIAGQYTSSLEGVIVNNVKITAPSNKSNTFIVMGENSPYITIVGQGIYGTSDNVSLNVVRAGKNPRITIVKESDTNTPFRTFSANGNKDLSQIKFNLKDQNIPFGNYYIYLTNTQLGDQAGKSNYVYIQVLDQSKIITADVTAGKLSLTYDANQKESALSATFEIKVKASDKDIIFNQGSFQFVTTDSNGYQTGSNGSYEIKGINSQSPVFPYTMKAGKEARFIINSYATPRLMFAGNYTMSLVGIYAQTSVPAGGVPSLVSIQVPKNETNSVIIIGELSPYINSIEPKPVIVGNLMTINGVRFTNGSIFIDGSERDPIVPIGTPSNDSTHLTFTAPPLEDGYHMLSVKNANGASNTVWFESTGGAITSTPVLNSISQATTTSGTMITLLGSGFLSKYSLVNFNGPATNIDSSPNSLTDSRIDIIVPHNLPDGLYNISVVNLDSRGGRLSSQIIPLFVSSQISQPSISLISQSISVVTSTDGLKSTAGGTFKFSVSSPTGDLHISRINTQEMVTIIFNGSGVGNPGNFVINSLQNSTGDTPAYYLVEAGTTRTFIAGFIIEPTSGSGQYRAQATHIVNSNQKGGGYIYFDKETYTNHVYLRGATVPTPTITVLSPNGGEEWVKGDTKTITWKSDPQSNYYKIEIWDERTAVGDSGGIPVPVNGDAWRVVESVTGNSYTWKVGDVDCGGPCTGPVVGGKYKITIRGMVDNSGSAGSYRTFDQSDSSFTITSGIITPPIVSEQVKCVFNGSNGTEKCYTVTDSNPSDWFSCTGTGTCVASVKGLKGSQLAWKSSCESKNLPITTTDGNNEYVNFSCGPIVHPTPTVTVNSPNGGEFWRIGNQYTVTFSTNNSTGPYKVYLEKYHEPSSGKEGVNSSLLIGETKTGSLVYNVPSSINSFPGQGWTYKIKVCDSSANCNVNDSSDNFFSIAPQLIMLYPNGGEILKEGDKITIKWNKDNVPSSTIDISLLDNPTRYGDVIIKNTPNDGYESWVVKPLGKITSKDGGLINPSGAYVVLVSCSDNNCIVDDSDSYFKIFSSITNTIDRPSVAPTPTPRSSRGLGASIWKAILDVFTL